MTSFSEQGNLLSQWRAYSGETGGYSIGFTRPYLELVGIHFIESRNDSFYNDLYPLASCRYCDKPEEESLKVEIKKIVDSYVAEADQSNWQTVPDTMEGFKEGLKILGSLAKKHFFPSGKRRAITKNQSFREEAEWRLIFQLERVGAINSEPEFRPGRSMPTPFFKVELTWENQPLEISEVIVGPCPHPLEAVNSIQRLLRKEGVANAVVRHSKIPYRNW